jgi:hypothetical protein
MKWLTDFAGQNWLITPVALAVHEPEPADIQHQKWLLVLTGVVEADIEGNSDNQWFHETVSFLPDMVGPLNFAIDGHSIPKPEPSVDFVAGFSIDLWAPFASLSSIYDQDSADNFGEAVDVWRPTPFANGTDALTNQPVGNIFTGIDVDVAVRDSDAWLYRVGYSITLVGRIVFLDHTIL